MSGTWVWDGDKLIELSEAEAQQRRDAEAKRWEIAQNRAAKIVARSSDEDKWALRQELAKPGSYYGDGGTIHDTTILNVETRDGKVVSVWYRCLMLPFDQTEVDADRAADMLASKPMSGINGLEWTRE